jgi:tetratricopeptide (TPR) repeat protein
LRSLELHEEAVRSFRRAIGARPVFPQAYCQWGDMCARLNQPEAALQCYAQALAQQPDFVDAWFQQGIMFQQLGRNADAEASRQSG